MVVDLVAVNPADAVTSKHVVQPPGVEDVEGMEDMVEADTDTEDTEDVEVIFAEPSLT